MSETYTIELTDHELAQLLAALYSQWDRQTNELSEGPSDDNPGWEQDALLWAIWETQQLMARLVALKPEYEYLLPPAKQRARYER